MLTFAVSGTSLPGPAGAAELGPLPTVDLRFTPVPVETVQEIQPTLVRARDRFEARDPGGVLASDQYRSGPLAKELIREQRLGMFGLYEAVRARVTIMTPSAATTSPPRRRSPTSPR